MPNLGGGYTACKFDMPHGSFSSWVQKFGMHWVSRQGLKSHGGDKGLGTTGHDDPYLGAFIDQAAYQGGAFVGSYSAANTQQNALSCLLYTSPSPRDS